MFFLQNSSQVLLWKADKSMWQETTKENSMNLTKCFLMVCLLVTGTAVVVLGPTVESPSVLQEVAILSLLALVLAGIYVWAGEED